MEGDDPTYAEAMEKFGGEASEVDLKGKTLVPGFIDGHAHFFGFGAQAVGADLLASPDGSCDNIEQLITSMKEWHPENGTDKTQGWIFGMGYDDTTLKENRHPAKEDLDKVSTEVPVMAIHISGHFSAVNSKALEMLQITADTKDPEGGVILRMPGSQEMAVSYGYTTAVEGRAMTNHEQLAGYKLTLDGSPQGRAAWRTMPYLIPPDGQKKGYQGYPAISKDEDV